MQIREELDLRQRSHIDWIREGDQGTGFFARAIRIRCSRNSIMRTLATDGSQVTNLQEMKSRLVTHFTDLFHCEERDNPVAIYNFREQVTGIMNAKLRAFPTEEEIRKTLFDMHPN